MTQCVVHRKRRTGAEISDGMKQDPRSNHVRRVRHECQKLMLNDMAEKTVDVVLKHVGNIYFSKKNAGAGIRVRQRVLTHYCESDNDCVIS